jgi:hypothetical protein
MFKSDFSKGVLASLVATALWTNGTSLVSPPVTAFWRDMAHHALVYLLKAGV